MDKFIESLPETNREICIYDSASETEGNVCTKEQVAAIKKKGWRLLYYDGKKVVE